MTEFFWESTPEFLSELIKELKRHSTIIIGEKVESEEEYELIRSIGIDIMQGYYMCNYKDQILKNHKNTSFMNL